MPLNAPHFPGEVEVNLSAATLTSSGCTSPALAIDDDPATAAVFGAFTFSGASVQINGSASYLNAGSIIRVTDALQAQNGSVFSTQKFDVTKFAIAFTFSNSGGSDGLTFCWQNAGPSALGQNGGGLGYQGIASSVCVKFDTYQDTGDPSDNCTGLFTGGANPLGGTAIAAPVFKSGHPIRASLLYDGETLTVTLTDTVTLAARTDTYAVNIPAQVGGTSCYLGITGATGSGQARQDITLWTYQGAAQIPAVPLRFLRVDWGTDKFITRVRLSQSGPGAANAGIDFESSLGLAEFGPPPPDVPFLAYMPLPVDGTVHELLVQPPVLANGIVFYPDAFLAAGSPAGSYPALNLSQLQVYEAITNPGVTPMANQPTVQPARVGVQSLILYPWITPSSLSLYQAGGNGANLYGLKTLNADATSKLAIVQGGETTHPLGGFGTDRQVKIGFENAKSDLSTFQKVFGGVFTLIPANVNGGEVQYFTENFADRELYVALVAQSTNGDGQELIVLPKLKVESVSYNLEKDKVTDIKMDFMRFWDYTYTRQDGQIGGIYERTFASTGPAAFHS